MKTVSPFIPCTVVFSCRRSAKHFIDVHSAYFAHCHFAHREAIFFYEQVMDRVFADKNKLPGHFTLITGPSMTADIQGGQFKGMHGRGKLIVILVG